MEMFDVVLEHLGTKTLVVALASRLQYIFPGVGRLSDRCDLLQPEEHQRKIYKKFDEQQSANHLRTNSNVNGRDGHGCKEKVLKQLNKNGGVHSYKTVRKESLFKVFLRQSEDLCRPPCGTPCIGQKFALLEMKSTISKLLRNFDISLADETLNSPLVLSAELVLISKNPLYFHIRQRSCA